MRDDESALMKNAAAAPSGTRPTSQLIIDKERNSRRKGWRACALKSISAALVREREGKMTRPLIKRGVLAPP